MKEPASSAAIIGRVGGWGGGSDTQMEASGKRSTSRYQHFCPQPPIPPLAKIFLIKDNTFR